MLVIVVAVGWKCTPRGHEPCHLLLSLGEHASAGDWADLTGAGPDSPPAGSSGLPGGGGGAGRTRGPRNWAGGERSVCLFCFRRPRRSAVALSFLHDNQVSKDFLQTNNRERLLRRSINDEQNILGRVANINNRCRALCCSSTRFGLDKISGKQQA